MELHTHGNIYRKIPLNEYKQKVVTKMYFT